MEQAGRRPSLGERCREECRSAVTSFVVGSRIRTVKQRDAASFQTMTTVILNHRHSVVRGAGRGYAGAGASDSCQIVGIPTGIGTRTLPGTGSGALDGSARTAACPGPS